LTAARQIAHTIRELGGGTVTVDEFGYALVLALVGAALWWQLKSGRLSPLGISRGAQPIAFWLQITIEATMIAGMVWAWIALPHSK
jgi:hypothetical protein